MYPMRLTWLYDLTIPVVIAAAYLIVKRLLQKTKADGACFVILLLLSPLMFHFIFVITGKEEVHSLMVHAHALWFFMAAALLERLPERRETEKKGLPLYTVFLVLTLMLCLGLTRYAEVCYQAAHYAQAQATGYLNRLVTKIEQTPGFSADTGVAFIGEYEKKADRLPSYDAFRAIVTFPYPRSTEELLNQYTWKLMMEQWCGFVPLTVDPARFAEMSEVQAMPCYPEEGSIAVIDGTVVVKFADSAASDD